MNIYLEPEGYLIKYNYDLQNWEEYHMDKFSPGDILMSVFKEFTYLCLFIGFITTLSGNLYYFLTHENSKIYQVSEYGKFKLLEGIESFDIKKIRENYEQLHFKTTLYYKRFYSYSEL